MGFRDKINSGNFVVTSEIGPPKGILIEPILDEVETFKDRIDAVNVTDLQSSVMRLGSLAVCSLLKNRGFEPIFQITCRDRNRLALQSDLLSASVLGVENVLVLTGDHPNLGDHPQAKPVFDLDSVQLLEVINTLNSGFDMVGNKLDKNTHFFSGAVVNPNAEPLEPEIFKMEKKIKAGANFFQTQAIYDVELFKNFLKLVKNIKIPILAGIVILRSAKMARYMNENIAGVKVSEDLIKRMVETKDKREESINIASELIKEFKHLCQGIHIMPIGQEDKVPFILDKAGL